jgi:5S rRNA maturation endonuclease (ribonuclease M5)
VESPKRIGEAGYLHRLRDDPLRPTHRIVRSVPLTSPVVTDPRLAALTERYRAAVHPDALRSVAASLGLTAASLTRLGIGWAADRGAWSFPMRDAAGAVSGIRLRRQGGAKFAVEGSRDGLFFPDSLAASDSRLLVCEGPTDTAALLDMGFGNVAGRPSCTGGIRLLVDLTRRKRPREVILVSDGDEPGRRGARNLASVLVAYVPAVRVIAPPDGIKDARQWLRAGGGRRDVEQAIDVAPVRRLAVRRWEASRGR